MVKIFLDKKQIKSLNKIEILEKIKNYLSKNNSSYVLLTCSKPTEDKNMEVEVSYEGEDHIVSYLIESAQEIINNKEKEIQDLP